MAYTDQKVLPKREDRLRTCNAYGGSSCGLVNDSRGGCLVNSGRSFSQAGGCQMNLALTIIGTIPGAYILMHSPPGCGGSLNQFELGYRIGQKARGRSQDRTLWGTTNLDEADVVHGGEDKLARAIIEADRRHRPELIFIITTCTPSIIGDDVDGVAAAVQPQVTARVVPVHCAGFRTHISATGYDAAYHGLARFLDFIPREQHLDEAERRLRDEEARRTVNLFNAVSIGRPDEIELERLLNALGLRVQVYPHFSDEGSFRDITRAALNVSICATHDDYFLEFLREKHGIPYIIDTMPIGIRNTALWLEKIAAHFGLEEEAQRLIAAEEAALEEGLSRYRPLLKGKRIYLGGGEMRVAATAMLYHELGAQVIGFRAHHYDQFGDDLYLRAASDNPAMEVNVATAQVFELVNLINRTRPDLYVGHGGSNSWVAKLGVPCLPLYATPQTYLGYKGVFEVARRSAKHLLNRSYQERLKGKAPLPYRAEWYEKDPYAYITDDRYHDSGPRREVEAEPARVAV